MLHFQQITHSEHGNVVLPRARRLSRNAILKRYRGMNCMHGCFYAPRAFLAACSSFKLASPRIAYGRIVARFSRHRRLAKLWAAPLRAPSRAEALSADLSDVRDSPRRGRPSCFWCCSSAAFARSISEQLRGHTVAIPFPQVIRQYDKKGHAALSSLSLIDSRAECTQLLLLGQGAS